MRMIHRLLLLCVALLAISPDDALMLKAASRVLVVATDTGRLEKLPAGR